MIKRYIDYRLGNPLQTVPPPWPRQITFGFAAELEDSSNWFVSVEKGSQRDKDFIDICSDLNIQCYGRSWLRVTGKDIPSLPFYYLWANQERTGSYSPEFLDSSARCNEGCSSGIAQKSKITIDISKSRLRNSDIVCLSTHRNYFVVSPKFKILLESSNVAGVMFVPCLEAHKSYSDEEREINHISESQMNDAPCFQLVITESTNAPPITGKVLHTHDGCDTCKTIGAFIGDGDVDLHWSCIEDIGRNDFHWFSDYQTPNMGILRMDSVGTVMSGKVAEIIEKNKIKGIKKFASKFKYLPCEIKGVTFK